MIRFLSNGSVMKSSDNFKIEKLQKEEWKFQIRIILQSSDLWDHVNGNVRRPLRDKFNKLEDFETTLLKFNKDDLKA